MLISIWICILCRFYKEQLTAVCYGATTVPQNQGYKRIISFSSLILSQVINEKQSRINLHWSVKVLRNWHSLKSLDKITTGVWGLIFSISECALQLLWCRQYLQGMWHRFPHTSWCYRWNSDEWEQGNAAPEHVVGVLCSVQNSGQAQLQMLWVLFLWFLLLIIAL